MSSTTTSGSRSSSPATPETPESPGYLDPPTIHDDMDNISSWYSAVTASDSTYWHQGSQHDLAPAKVEEDSVMLPLDDLIQEHAYDDSSSSNSPPPSGSTRLAQRQLPPQYPITILHAQASTATPSSRTTSVMTPKPTSKSTLLPSRKRSGSSTSRVVTPAKESCSNLQIITPSIPSTGAKSRVETQIRVTIDLAHSVLPSGDYDRVGSWKWLRLPKGAATKKRTRKEGKIDPKPEDTLCLTTEVTCASPPHAPVVCCSSCQTRESKRVARKIAQRVRPQRPDSDSPDSNADPSARAPFTIVQFNCAEVLEFENGSTTLPLRITCYCRHHRERTGFHVHFKMSDHTGRIVATGRTAPIMITDDHKSTHGSAKQAASEAAEAEAAEASAQPGSKRKYVEPSETSQKRARNVQPGSATPGSPAASTDVPSSVPTREATPAQAFNSSSFTSFTSAGPATPSRPDEPHIDFAGVPGLSPAPVSPMDVVASVSHALSPSAFLPTSPSSPSSVAAAARAAEQVLATPTAITPLPFLFFQPNPPPLGLPTPKIHRLIPAQGPTIGGIEVTVLGANFHPGLQLDCVFGDVVASTTHRWSENTLVCILPPRAASGVVGVWFSGVPKEEDGTPPSLFTYLDESDRSLMELALQVVGLQMTGKLEDAKSVAMRIIAPDNGGGSSNSASTVPTNVAQLAASWSLDLRGTRSPSELEKMVLQTLALLDLQLDIPTSPVTVARAISHTNGSGQTLLHFAAFQSLPALVRFLTRHGVDLDIRDRNGFTALHFAGLVGARQCARILLDAGADVEIVDASGRTAQELASFNFATVRAMGSSAEDEPLSSSVEEVEDEEARWGDAEEESETEVPIRRRRPRPSRRSDLPTHALSSSEDEKPPREIEKGREAAADEKRAASLLNTLQRKFAPAQGFLPQLAMPWPALPLPQMPTVFPAFFQPHLVQDVAAVRAFLTPQEWRAYWEKWMLYARAQQQQTDEPPPMYTPRAEDTAADTKADTVEEKTSSVPISAPAEDPVLDLSTERVARRATYDATEPVSDREVDAYAFRSPKQQQQAQTKEDRMLLLFWIPILIIALIWAFVHGVRLAMHGVRSLMPLRAIVRV